MNSEFPQPLRHDDALYISSNGLKNFVIPGGHPQVSNTHLARCVCRRAERYITELKELTTEFNSELWILLWYLQPPGQY